MASDRAYANLGAEQLPALVSEESPRSYNRVEEGRHAHQQRQGTRLGGVSWSTWQWVGNILRGSGDKIGTYKVLAKALERSGQQAGHLNQAKAFPRIPYNEGVAIAMEGVASVKGTMHNAFHGVLEAFWAQFRADGPRFRQVPKNAEYETALRSALQAIGKEQDEVDALARLAAESRRANGYFDGPGGELPEVPDKIPGF